MIQVVPVASSSVDWQALLTATEQLLGRSIAQGLDDRRVPVGNLASYLAALGEMEHENSDPSATVREAGTLLRHCHFSFLAFSTRQALQEVVLVSGLSATFAHGDPVSCAVVSGDLERWRSALLACCTERSPVTARVFAERCLRHFERVGLGQIWASFEKRPAKDSTLLLGSQP